MNGSNETKLGPFQRILVGTDLSPTARNALDWAIEIARAHGAELTIVHAQIPPGTAATAPGDVRPTSRSLTELEAAARSSGVTVSTKVQEGPAWRILAELAVELSVDLIVVGSRGHTVMLPLLLGSTTDRLMRVATVPVLAVHPGDARHEPGVDTVLLATDFSDAATAALEAAARLLRGFEGTGRLILLHVEGTPGFYESPPPPSASAHGLPDITGEAISQLESMADPLRETGLDVVTIVRDGYAPIVISEEARTHDVDLIAVGGHGQSALAALLIGSVAERVLHHAHRPVLLVRSTS